MGVPSGHQDPVRRGGGGGAGNPSFTALAQQSLAYSTQSPTKTAVGPRQAPPDLLQPPPACASPPNRQRPWAVHTEGRAVTQYDLFHGRKRGFGIHIGYANQKCSKSGCTRQVHMGSPAPQKDGCFQIFSASKKGGFRRSAVATRAHTSTCVAKAGGTRREVPQEGLAWAIACAAPINDRFHRNCHGLWNAIWKGAWAAGCRASEWRAPGVPVGGCSPQLHCHPVFRPRGGGGHAAHTRMGALGGCNSDRQWHALKMGEGAPAERTATQKYRIHGSSTNWNFSHISMNNKKSREAFCAPDRSKAGKK